MKNGKKAICMGIEILGVSLSNASLRESLRRTDEFFKAGKLNTIAYVSTDKLVLASEDEEQKKYWADVDLVLFSDAEVLKAAGITAVGRLREIEENSYLKDFLRKLVRGQKEVFLLSDTREHLEKLESEMKQLQGNLYIVGREALEDYPESKDSLVNAINLVAPRVILSRVPYPEEIRLMYEYREYLNAAVWLTIPTWSYDSKKDGLLDKLNKFLYKKVLYKKISHSKDTEND